jgi:hypothetical protein
MLMKISRFTVFKETKELAKISFGIDRAGKNNKPRKAHKTIKTRKPSYGLLYFLHVNLF